MGVIEMKKIIATILTAVLVLTACSDTVLVIVEPVPMYINGIEVTSAGSPVGHGIRYMPLEELLDPEWGVDFVVIGEIVEENAELEYTYSDYYKKDIIIGGNAYGQLLVTEVLMGDIEVGETVKLWRRYGFDEELGLMFIFDGRTPMHVGDRWICFLSYQEHVDAYSADWQPIPDRHLQRVMKNFPKEASRIHEEHSERNAEIWAKAHIETLDNVDISAFGVMDTDYIDFALYKEILEHFKIEPEEWINPGRGYDARLIELRSQAQARPE
jgi:hypothetical protein